jgi:predicted RNA-binding Zn-ribbon protein involved in translation (DUF1610 family)
MPGFRAGVQELIDGEWVIYVETDAASTGCPECGVVAVAHGRRPVAVRDLPVSGRSVVLAWAKRIWRCPEVDFETRTWSERSELISPAGGLTERARAEICRRVGAEEDSWRRWPGSSGCRPNPLAQPTSFGERNIGWTAGIQLVELLRTGRAP